MEPVGVAIIGCGGMGSWHANNLASQPGVTVVAVADAYEPSAVAVAEHTGARVMNALEAINDSAVDAVLIASNDETHSRFAVSTIDAGKFCFLEKPLGATLQQAESVLFAETSLGRIVTRVGFMRELDPAHAQVKARLASLGEVTRVRCVHRNVDASQRDASSLFAQSMIHDIHTIRWLSGQEFVRVSVHVADRADGFRDVLLVGELSEGALGTIDFEDQGFAYEVQVEVTAERGMAATLPHPRSVVKTAEEQSMFVGADWFGRFEDAYRLEIEQWCRSITGVASEPGGPTVWDGYAAQVVAGAGVDAMISGNSVDVDLMTRPTIYS